MEIAKIDPRLASVGIEGESVEWISSHDGRFSLYGVYFDSSDGLYKRVPDDVIEAANPSIHGLARMTAGGRLRFMTNSPFIQRHDAIQDERQGQAGAQGCGREVSREACPGTARIQPQLLPVAP